MDTKTTPHNLLLDVGGTFIKCSDGRSIPVNSTGDRDEITASIREAVGECASYECIGVAIPGPFDYNRGIFLMKHKFSSVYGDSFASLSGAPDSVRFRFIHDVNCMLLGEMTSGNAAGYGNTALVALGTGLGFAVSTDGKIRTNAAGSPEISIFNKPYEDGILEDYISKRGISRLFSKFSGKDGDDITVREIAGLAYSGNKAAACAFAEAGHILGKSIAPLLVENAVECLLFGGQISRSFSLMENALKTELMNIGCLRKIDVISDFDNATFNGLKNLLTTKQTI